MKKKAYKHKTESELEEDFYLYWRSRYPLSLPAIGYKFHPTRRFRFDFAWVRAKIAVEIQGIGPGHCGIRAMTKDYDRQIEALLLNWRIVYLTGAMIKEDTIEYNCLRIARLLGLTNPPETRKGYIPLKERKRY